MKKSKPLKKNMTVGDLAVMVANGFDGMQKQMGGMQGQIRELQDGQEQIKLKLDNVA